MILKYLNECVNYNHVNLLKINWSAQMKRFTNVVNQKWIYGFMEGGN